VGKHGARRFIERTTILSLLALFAPSALAADAGTFAPQEIQAGESTIAVSFEPGPLDLPRDAWLQRIEQAEAAVRTYYGKFPVARYDLRVEPRRGPGMLTGTTWGYPAPLTRLTVGEHTTQAALRDDWVITHEMVHLAFPSVDDVHHWIEEGIATYVEPIARVEAGQIGVDEVWRQLVDGLPKGLPKSGDHGLDHTHTWGRTYWGGALYCLLADVRLREATHNRAGLQDALAAIVAHGGSIHTDWPLEQALQVADAATGTQVLEELYAQMRDAPYDVDLDALWRKLGVKPGGGGVTYDDAAPQAAIRIAITRAPAR